MPTEGWAELKRLVDAALDLPTEEQRLLLADRASTDPELSARAAAILDADRRASGFLEKPPIDAWVTLLGKDSEAPAPGSRIGPYEVVRSLGAGGMGHVLLAVRADDSYRQQVAIKLAEQALDSASLRRFRRERQILADLEHPSIARLYDGGSTERGLPYLVMEHVEGEPIDRHAERLALSLRARLVLFRKVLAAVAHAHRSLVIHLDLKPSNILVRADGEPKLLDFGIARLLDRNGRGETTEGLRPMTLDYASPEQLRGDRLTTASDVYSLGVVLYRLLTGTVPHDRGEGPALDLAAEALPEPPSRRGPEKPWARRLAGDLDAIVLKALRREPEARYGSVEQLDEDLGRYLAGLPVLARRGTWRYRTRRFVRRHWLVLVLATVSFLALAAAMVVTSHQARRIAHERDQAAQARAETGEVSLLLAGLLEGFYPVEAEGIGIAVPELLDLAFAVLFGTPTPPSGQSYEKLSPFDMVRFDGDDPQVRVGERWYAPVEIAGVDIETILDFSRQQYGAKWSKRFAEDLVEILTRLGEPPGTRVSLVLRELESGELQRLDGVEMSEEKRRAIWQARTAAQDALAREELLAKLRRNQRASHHRLSREHIDADLYKLEWHLQHEFSYLTRTGVDFRQALQTLRAAGGEGMATAELHIRLHKLVARFGDGHSRVSGVRRALPPGFLPAALADVGGRLVALGAGGGLLDPRHPYLVAIDGLPVERWIEAASALAPRGSEQLIRSRAIRWLAWIQYLRQDLERTRLPEVELTLASLEGSTKTLVRRVGDQPLLHRPAPLGSPRELAGGIGYLPLPSMITDGADIAAIHAAMDRFRGAPALVIDVRGNGGGRRDALQALMPYFLAEDAPPLIANVAAYRLPPGTEPDLAGHLADRALYPLTSERWSAAERRAIGALAATFRPEWPLPEGFSDWHYFVIRRQGPEGLYHFDRPIAVLLDEGCFSATDIFLGAFAELPQATLIGLPSGGGSGRSQSIWLDHSGLRVRLSTMASYRPDGRLYEGRGIHPDLRVERALDDVLGHSDSTLSFAVEHLLARKPAR